MGYTELKLDKVVDQVSNAFAKSFQSSNALCANVAKKIIPKGTNSFKVPIPASLTGAKRVAGGATTAGSAVAPTSFIASANTEYFTTIKIDNLDAVGTEYRIDEFQAVEAADTIISKLNEDIWTLAAAITQTVGVTGTVPAITLLNSAQTKLFEAKVPPQSQLCAIVGSAEDAAWKTAMTVSDYGTIANEMKQSGIINNPYGFKLGVDQQRYGTSGTDARNIAFHPNAFMVGYRQDFPENPGTILSQSTDPKTGITIFARYESYADSTGEGMQIKFFIVAKAVTAYDLWACQILG